MTNEAPKWRQIMRRLPFVCPRCSRRFPSLPFKGYCPTTWAIISAPWLEPGEAIVYRHEGAAHAGAPSWCVEADSLTAAEVLADGRVQFTYRGSLR